MTINSCPSTSIPATTTESEQVRELKGMISDQEKKIERILEKISQPDQIQTPAAVPEAVTAPVIEPKKCVCGHDESFKNEMRTSSHGNFILTGILFFAYVHYWKTKKNTEQKKENNMQLNNIGGGNGGNGGNQANNNALAEIITQGIAQAVAGQLPGNQNLNL